MRESDMLTFLARHLRTMATRLVGMIRENFGGERHYIRTPSKTFRNEDIARDWDRGMSKGALSEKYAVSVATVSRVIKLYCLPPKRPSQGQGLGRDGWNL